MGRRGTIVARRSGMVDGGQSVWVFVVLEFRNSV